MAQAFLRITQGEALVRLLLDKQATKAGIKSGIDWLAENVRPDDLAVFFYSGHGARYRDQDNDEPDGFDEFLCPQDTGMNGGVETFIRDDEMRLWLQAITGKTKNLAVIFDCVPQRVGRAGGRGDRTRDPARGRGRDARRLQTAARQAGGVGRRRAAARVTCCSAAAQDHQSSYELRGMKNGLFTTVSAAVARRRQCEDVLRHV